MWLCSMITTGVCEAFANCCIWSALRLAVGLPLCKPPTQEGAGLSLITRQLEDDREEGYRATLREVKASNGKQQSPAGE